MKARLYASYGVQELWVIDARRRRTLVHGGAKPDGTWATVKQIPGTTALAPKALPDIETKISDLN